MQGLILALLVLLTARMVDAYQASSWGGSVVAGSMPMRARSFPRRRQQLSKGLAATTTGSSEFESIREIDVVSSLYGKKVRIGELWRESDTAVLICFRSFG